MRQHSQCLKYTCTQVYATAFMYTFRSKQALQQNYFVLFYSTDSKASWRNTTGKQLCYPGILKSKAVLQQNKYKHLRSINTSKIHVNVCLDPAYTRTLQSWNVWGYIDLDDKNCIELLCCVTLHTQCMYTCSKV